MTESQIRANDDVRNMYQELCGERYEYKVKSINMVEHQKFQGISLLDIRKTSFLLDLITIVTAYKIKFSIKDFFSECDQIRSCLRIWSHLQQKSLMEILIFCLVCVALL